MYRILFLFLILTTIDCYPQKEYFILENENVNYQKVFILPGKSSEEVENLLIASIPTTKTIVNFNQQRSVITATISSQGIDCRKYLPKKNKLQCLQNSHIRDKLFSIGKMKNTELL
jgi:hypothetical protein